MEIPQFNAAAPPKCGADEEYRTCGSSCIPTCAMPLPKPWCTRRCAVGCYCKEGYLRNEQNVCVPAAKCKSIEMVEAAPQPINIPLEKMPLNPHRSTPVYIPLGPGPVIFPTPRAPFLAMGPFPTPNLPGHPWGPGPVILPTHDTPILPLAPGPIIIEMNQQPGSINIPLHKEHPVAPVCSEKEHYVPCGVQLDCLASCKIPTSNPKCYERMCTPGCVCKKPYVRHADGRCVEQSECPKN